MTRTAHHKVEPVFVAFVTGYEFAALVAHSEKVPTITQLVSCLPKLARRTVAVAAGVWIWLHFDDETAAWFYRLFSKADVHR